MDNLPLNPEREMLLWGPSPMKLFYCDAFEAYFFDFPRSYPGYGWPPALALFKGRQFIWIQEREALQEAAGKIFLDRMLPLSVREEARKKWMETDRTLHAVENEVDAATLSVLSNKDFMLLWKKFHMAICTFWVEAMLPELSNYGSIEILEEKLKQSVPEEEIMQAMEVLTAPEQLSFYQEEEIELSETEDIDAHQRKYFWLKNSYANAEVCTVAFFEERKRALPPRVREVAYARLESVKREKAALQKKYDISEENMAIASAIADGVSWQDVRKKSVWIYVHYKDVLINEVARRFGFPKDQLLLLNSIEITDLLEGRPINIPPEERGNAYGFYLTAEHSDVLDNATTLRFLDLYVTHAVDEGITEFRGIVACKGRGPVRGKVRIVLDAHAVGEFDTGDILVTSMTTPEFVFVMKKSAAVLTDTGGLTSHAAIVSRELGVPCLVGTKIATRVLKDGDRVEVDAEKGVVRKL